MIIVVGCLSSWIGSWVTYGIGESVELSQKVLKKLEGEGKSDNKAPASSPAAQPASVTGASIKCRNCGALNAPGSKDCRQCYHSLFGVPTSAAVQVPTDKKVCPHCGARNMKTNTTCFACNEPFADQ